MKPTTKRRFWRPERWTLALGLAAGLLGAVALAPLEMTPAVADDAKKKPGKKKPQKKPQKEPQKKRATVDAKDVYFGSHKRFSKPAEVDAGSVFAEISDYKKIKDEKLEPDSARYQLLMSRASRKFLKAVKSAAKSSGYDLVAESGSVDSEDHVPTITQDVIDAL